MKHIRTTSKQHRVPAPAASNFAVLLNFFINVNRQIIDFIFKF